MVRFCQSRSRIQVKLQFCYMKSMLNVDSSRRAGLPPTSLAFKELLETLIESTSISIYGFYSHSGHSYMSTSLQEALGILCTEIESVNTAASLAHSLLSTSNNSPGPLFVLSIGSTPIAQAISSVSQIPKTNGVLEIHAGNYPLLDLQQLSTNLIEPSWISARVLATVISYYPSRGVDGGDEALCDAGANAMSKDTSPYDEFGTVTKYGCSAFPIGNAAKWKVGKISQEHGILVCNTSIKPGAQNAKDDDRQNLEVGCMVEIIPRHACLAATAHPWYYIVDSEGVGNTDKIVDIWVPWKGW
jgi:D-serine deaminase-like pyridoxal phosphate-dependent protein